MYEKCSIFVGNLAIFCTEKDIEDAFSPFGQILSISIKCDEETSKNLSYGFIKFGSEISAHQAMKSLNGSLLCGRPLRIGRALKEKSKEKYPVTSSKLAVLETSSIHVTYISYQINNLVTEESLRAIFSSFGDVLDASIKKSTVDEIGNCQSGYGFVHFSNSLTGIESAFKAARSLYDVQIDNVNYICKISHALENHLKANTQRVSPHSESLPAVVPLTALPSFTRQPVKHQQHVLLDRSNHRENLHVEPNLFPSNYNSSVYVHSNQRQQQQLSPSASEPSANFFAESKAHFTRPNNKTTTKSGPLLSTRVRESSFKPFPAPQTVLSRESLVEQESFFGRTSGQALKRSELISTSISSQFGRDTSYDDNNPHRLFSYPHHLSTTSLDNSFPLDQFHHCNLMALEQSAMPLQSSSSSSSSSWSFISSPKDYNNNYNYHNNNNINNHKFEPTFCQGPQIW